MIGALPVTRYGLLAASALMVFWLLSAVILRKARASYAQFAVYALCTAVFGWLVSRVVFALFSIPTYINEYDGYFAAALYFLDGGYSMTGMMLGALLGAVVAAALTKLERGTALNAAGLGLPGAVAVLRLAEFLCDTAESGDIGEGDYIAEGWVGDLLSRMGLMMQADGDLCYPICLLEAAAALLILVGMGVWLLRRRELIPGDAAMVAVLLLCLCQVLMEPLRDDGHLTFHFVPFQQVLALVMATEVLMLWVRKHRRASSNKRLSTVVTILALVCIAVGVLACFMIDRYENKIVAWALLIVPMLVMGGAALYTRAAANYAAGE